MIRPDVSAAKLPSELRGCSFVGSLVIEILFSGVLIGSAANVDIPV
jgi:hypothetical protein